MGGGITYELSEAIVQGEAPANTVMRTFRAGEKVPNFTLHPAPGLNPGGSSIRVAGGSVGIKDLITADMGETHWAACTARDFGRNARLVQGLGGLETRPLYTGAELQHLQMQAELRRLGWLP